MKAGTIALFALAAGGFFIASVATKKKDPTVTIGGVDYRAKLYEGDGGQWYVQVFVADAVSGDAIGPFADEEQAGAAAASYLATLGHSSFYSLRSDPEMGWFFDGWSDGAKVDSGGPFANEAAAKTAGNTWLNTWLKLPQG